MRDDTRQQTQSDPTGPNWFQSILVNTVGGASGTGGGNTLEEILQSTLFGMSGRQGLTSHPLTGILPKWVFRAPEVLNAVRAGSLDPYMPGGGTISESGSVPDAWRVYTGPGAITYKGAPRNKFSSDMAPGSETVLEPGHDKSQTASSVKNQPYLWSQDQVADAIKKFQDAGATSVTDFDSLTKAWGGLVDRAAATYSLSSGQRKVTPWDVLDLYKTEMQKAGTFGSSGSSGVPTTVHATRRTVSTITHGDAWNVLRDTMSRMLGHDPNDEEVRDFLGRMNHIAAKNPTIETSTTTGNGTASEHTTSRVKSGFNANDILENAYKDAQADQDYAETQSATTYYNAALSALGAIGG